MGFLTVGAESTLANHLALAAASDTAAAACETSTPPGTSLALSAPDTAACALSHLVSSRPRRMASASASAGVAAFRKRSAASCHPSAATAEHRAAPDTAIAREGDTEIAADDAAKRRAAEHTTGRAIKPRLRCTSGFFFLTESLRPLRW